MADQKTVLITGASGGIGEALCCSFRREGYYVLGLDVLPSNCDVDSFIQSDLERLCRDEGYCVSIIEEVISNLGNNLKLDVLVNNAAIQVIKPIEQISSTDWIQSLNVNLVAPFLLSQKLFAFLERSGGSIVNIASIHARLTKPNFVCYATSKSALVGLTKSMAVEMGSKVRVNAICPAAVATPMLMAGFDGREDDYLLLSSMHPVSRIGQPSEIAEAALFLASDKARFINGACLELDGGIGSRLHDPI